MESLDISSALLPYGDKTEEHLSQIATLRVAGMRIDDVADQLGLPTSYVSNCLDVIRRRWAAQQLDIADEFLLDLRRLDTALEGIFRGVMNGDLPSIDRMLRILKRRAEMIGYDAQDRDRSTVVDAIISEQSKHIQSIEADQMTDDDLADIIRNYIADNRVVDGEATAE